MSLEVQDRDYEAWNAVRDAIPPACRPCRRATDIAFQEYEDIMALQKTPSEAAVAVSLMIRSQCEVGYVELDDGGICTSR